MFVEPEKKNEGKMETVETNLIAEKMETVDTDIIALVNFNSGGKNGKAVVKAFQKHELLGKDKVFNLSDGGPKKYLEEFKNVKDLRVIVCGGDGTINWVLTTIQDLKMPHNPAVAIIPLGTGNDTSRVFGWGYKFASIRAINKMVTFVSTAESTEYDRWHLQMVHTDSPSSKTKKGFPPSITTIDKQPSFLESKLDGRQSVFNNYLSFGVDAQIVNSFHHTRETHRGCFCCRCCNRAWFGFFGLAAICCCLDKKLDMELKVMLEDKDEWENLSVSQYKGIIILNLPVYAGGRFIWPKDGTSLTPPSVSDGLLEIIGVKDACHMGCIGTGVAKGVRLAQAKEIQFSSNQKMFAQMDGEPWPDSPCVYHIRRYRGAKMLLGPKNTYIK